MGASLIEKLLDKGGARVSVGNRWMIRDSAEWMVLEREYRARSNTCHYRGIHLVEAIRALEGDWLSDAEL